jgi:hypothetical protein
LDNLVTSAELAGQARSPLLCHPSVLEVHARDRRIRRYVGETEASWRTRLAKWRQIWASAGRAWGILRQLRILLAPYGRPRLRYVSTGGDADFTQWFTLEPGDPAQDYFFLGGTDPDFWRALTTPGNWLWDAGASVGHWSRFWLIIYIDKMPTGTWAQWDGSDAWDDNVKAWGGLPVVQAIIDLANEWKAAHSALWGVILCSDPDAYDPAGSGAGYPNGYGWLTHAPDGTPQHPAGAELAYARGPVSIL